MILLVSIALKPILFISNVLVVQPQITWTFIQKYCKWSANRRFGDGSVFLQSIIMVTHKVVKFRRWDGAHTYKRRKGMKTPFIKPCNTQFSSALAADNMHVCLTDQHFLAQQIGLDECVKELAVMFNKAKESAGLDSSCQLESLVSTVSSQQ